MIKYINIKTGEVSDRDTWIIASNDDDPGVAFKKALRDGTLRKVEGALCFHCGVHEISEWNDQEIETAITESAVDRFIGE